MGAPVGSARGLPAGSPRNTRPKNQQLLRRSRTQEFELRTDSIRASCCEWRSAPRGIECMPLRAFPVKAERTAVFAEACGRSWINAFSQIQSLRILFRTHRRQNSLRCKRRLMQAHPDRIVDCVCNRRDRRRQRSLAAFFCAKRTFGIDALHNDRLDLWRFHRRWAAILKQPGIHQHAVFPDHFFGEGLPHAHPHRTDDLAFYGNRIQRAPAVVSGPDFVHDHFAAFLRRR